MSEYIIDLNDENANVVFGICDGIHQEIVRCRDCREYNTELYKHITCELLARYVEPDGFCSRGERK